MSTTLTFKIPIAPPDPSKASQYAKNVEPSQSSLSAETELREGEHLDLSIITPDEVDHRFCAGSVFARVFQRRIFLESSQQCLLSLRSLPRRQITSCLDDTFDVYAYQHNKIVDTFCLLDYQVMPVQGDPFSQFKLVTSLGKEKLPRPPLSILVQSLRFDVSVLSEMLRRDLCTVLHPDNILDQSAKLLKKRLRIIRVIQNLYSEHCIMLAPRDDAFFFRSCEVCSIYDPEIIHFCRDLHCILLKILHGQSIKLPSCHSFTPLHEMSDAPDFGDAA
ncbi:uncharacterized protein MEPE_04064 [Melanopsichium pennsylvanicum]|uniref:Uncharacterized protein n=2 Tax=Melanopsichium pennsylvanicum TaxID=63383 RepID=A0AAJ4XML2_9BASI|nr:hypothetical protein BN887_04464 [Melanopsichium pennsylvanicum 4]SNX85355.1 uncharacterized protein MEPE_04064 [Melanopsichium pennsylvanicum]